MSEIENTCTTCIRLKSQGIPVFLFLGCLVETLKEMFPGESEEDLIATLRKNNFDLETSVNDVLCSEAGESILIVIYFESRCCKFLDMDIIGDEILDTSHDIMH